MKATIYGGAGFVGLNIAENWLRLGHAVTLFDSRAPGEAALATFRALPGRLDIVIGDGRDPDAVARALPDGTDVVVAGIAITADAKREATDPETILAVNLLVLPAILRAARAKGVGRIISLSSAAAYGMTGERVPLLTETDAVDPAGFYGLTKWASERIGARLGGHWGLDVVSLRLSGAFGPWEHDTGVRDTLSPQFQVFRALAAGRPALLPRPAPRDWIDAGDVAAAVDAVARARSLPRSVYNVTGGAPWPVLEWGRLLARHVPDAVCRLAGPGEEPTIDLFGPGDRAPMSGAALAGDVRWRAGIGMEASVLRLVLWARAQGLLPRKENDP